MRYSFWQGSLICNPFQLSYRWYDIRVIERAASSGTIGPEFARQRVKENAVDIVAGGEKFANCLSVDGRRRSIWRWHRNTSFRFSSVSEHAILATA